MEAINRSGLEVALICGESRKLLGMVTDGDIRRALLRGDGLQAPIMAAANTRFTAVGRNVHASEAVQLMFQNGFKCIPVINEQGELIDLHTLWVALLSQDSGCWAVVMAGGKGTRLGELTRAIPKPMVPVGDRPILERIVQLLVSHGIRRIFLAVNTMGRMVEDHFGDGSRFYCNIEYLRETTPLGTAGPLRLLPEKPQRPVIVMNGDLLTSINLSRMLAFHQTGAYAATMALRRHVVEVPYGVARLADGRVVGLEEKPKLSYDINAGIYVIDPPSLDLLPSGFAPMTSLLQACIDDGRPIGAYPMQEAWHDIGLPSELERAQQLCAVGDESAAAAE